MADSWGTIVRWLELHCPDDVAGLRPPATEADLRAAADELGVALPAELTTWWRRADGAERVRLLPPSYTPYSVREALSSRQSWLEISAEDGDRAEGQADQPAGTECWGEYLPLWLPIAHEIGGDDLFLDLRPGPAHGCVGEFRHDEWTFRRPRWPGVEAMLAELAEALTNTQPLSGWIPQPVDDSLHWDLPPRPRPRVNPVGGIRVSEVTPQEVGLHGDQPPYVPRDLDVRLREQLVEAAGCVLLVGEPLAGKTRTAFEAVTAVRPDWDLVPVRSDQQLLSVARAGYRRQVVWIDNLRADRFGPAFVVAALTDLRRSDAVTVATCLPDEYATLLPFAYRNRPRATPPPSRPGAMGARNVEDIRADEYAELEALLTVLELPAALSPAELSAAEQAGHDDQRIRAALTDPAGLIPALAGGSAQVRRWEHPDDPDDRAVVTVAADARRVGARSPLSRELLAAAAPGSPSAWPEMPTGYVIGDYLYDHVRRARAAEPVPEATWRALVEHHHPSDSFALAEAAVAHGRPEHAEAIYRALVAAAEGADPSEQTEVERWARGRRAQAGLQALHRSS